jgi:transposase
MGVVHLWKRYCQLALSRIAKELTICDQTSFVLFPRRRVIERNFGWVSRFRRLARDYERLPETLAGLHFLAFAILLLNRFVQVFFHSS